MARTVSKKSTKTPDTSVWWQKIIIVCQLLGALATVLVLATAAVMIFYSYSSVKM